MGTHPSTSVVDRDCRTWDHANLYICDASVFVTPGGAQPGQTIMALAARLADQRAPAQHHRSAKRPVTVAAGPYGHPFHPLLVVVPIGAWVASLVFDLASYRAGEPDVFVKAAFWLIGLGILGALLAAVVGLLDLLAIPRGTKAFTTGLIHMGLNLTVVALFAVGFAVRREGLEDAPVAAAPLLISIVALTLLGVSGWLGGKLTYTYGVRVVDEETQAEGYGTETGERMVP